MGPGRRRMTLSFRTIARPRLDGIRLREGHIAGPRASCRPTATRFPTMKKTSPDRQLRRFSKQTASVRRKQLIEATFRCLCMYGVGDTSVRTIAAEANLSLGMVRHHFNSKDELLASTYR